MNKKEKENIKEAEEEEEEEEGIWVREQRKRSRRRRRRRREEELADQPDLAPASDGGQWQQQRAEVRGLYDFFIFFHCWHVGAMSEKRKKKKKRLAGHRNPASCTRSSVQHRHDAKNGVSVQPSL